MTWVPGEDVDDAPFPEDRERRLRNDGPAESLEQLDNGQLGARVPPVEQPQPVVAGRPDSVLEPGAVRFGDGTQLPDGDSVEATCLDPHHDTARHTRLAGDVALPEPLLNPERAQEGPGLTIVHAMRIAGGDCAPIHGNRENGEVSRPV